jgi:hypothetical protein
MIRNMAGTTTASGTRTWRIQPGQTLEFACTRRRPPEPCALGSGSSNASSNTDTLGRTDADPLEHNGADHPKNRTAPDGFNTN